ncbi:MAG: ComEA family DNA-binding protein [Gemmatimonadaceae bacterium]
MPVTPAERKTLLFLVALLGLGAATRLAGAVRQEREVVARDSPALAAQLAAVDSARAQRREEQRSRRTAVKRSKRSTRSGAAASDTSVIVDVDRATAAELDRLPRIGPKLAQRIVADRDSHGAFGSVIALTRVNGIGPKLMTRLAPHVTFSGSVRPSTAFSEDPRSARRRRVSTGSH